MFIATLIANPQNANLTEALLDEARAAMGAAEVTWLAKGIAAEFEVAQPGVGDLWQRFQAHAIDLVVLPAKNRRKKLLIADMDSTMIQQECIDELAVEAGIGEKVAEITARAMNGELDFEGAIKERVGLLKDLDIGAIQRVLDTRITYTPGGAALLATMKANGGYAALVSGGFTDFTAAVAQKLGFDENRANTLHNANGKLTGEVGEPILGRDAKVQALNEITTKLGIGLDDAIAVGDGANDLGMLQAAGAGVALHAKPSVQAEADIVLNHADLTGLLYLQGYKKSEFAQS